MELKQHTISGLKQWPNVINDTLESDGPSSTQGNTGGLLKWRLDEQNQLIVSKLSDSDKPSKLTLWTRRDTSEERS
jgi:hypothetical protein